MTAPPACRALDAELWSLYRQGNGAFHRANGLAGSNPQEAEELYQKAALVYERIVREEGIENGKLYYNLGNIHFRLRNIGKAILYYRRAEKWISNDPNLRHNLSYARSRRVDRVAEQPRTQVFKALFFWHYDLSLFGRAVAFMAFFNLVWILAAVRLFRSGAWLRWSLLITVAGALVFGGSVGFQAYKEKYHPSGVVLAEEVTARKGDSTAYQPSFKAPLHSGTEFRLIEKRQGWYHIELDDGRRCWIPGSSAGLV